MLWLFILLALGFMLGGILYALPSRPDRQRASLRDLASQSGYLLFSRTVPDGSVAGRVAADKLLLTFYGLKSTQDMDLPEFVVFRTTGANGNYLPEGWDWLDDEVQRPLGELISPVLTQLPERFGALSYRKKQGLALAWREELTDSQLSQLQAAFALLLALNWQSLAQQAPPLTAEQQALLQAMHEDEARLQVGHWPQHEQEPK